MGVLEVKQISIQRVEQIAKLMGKMKLAEFMSLSEAEFQKLIQEVENNPLFKRLTIPGAGIVKYKKFSKTGLAYSRSIPLDPTITPSRNYLDIEPLLAQEEEIIQIIKEVGVDKFKKYFLDGIPGMTLGEIARECNSTKKKVKKVNNFVDKFYLEAKLTESSQGHRIQRTYYSTIASIEKRKDEFIINYFSREIVKGRYLINFDRFEELKKRKIFTSREVKKINSLFNKLRLINSRKITIYQIIKKLIEVQYNFLTSGSIDYLKPFTQASLSKKIGVNPSLISRAIKRKAIRIPQGRQIPIKILFPSKREIRKKLIREIIEQEKSEIEKGILSRPYSDEEIRAQLRKKNGISISRRSVSECRKDLKIPSSFKRVYQG